jgi:hypothetical protein
MTNGQFVVSGSPDPGRIDKQSDVAEVALAVPLRSAAAARRAPSPTPRDTLLPDHPIRGADNGVSRLLFSASPYLD